MSSSESTGIFIGSQQNNLHMIENSPMRRCPWLMEWKNYRFECTACGFPVLQYNRCTCNSEYFCSECTQVLESPAYQTILRRSFMEYWCSCVERSQQKPYLSNSEEFISNSQAEKSLARYQSELNQAFVPDNSVEVSNTNPTENHDKYHASPTEENRKNFEMNLDLFLRSKGVQKERKVSNASRKFYEYQDKLIEGYEEVNKPNDDKYARSKILRKKTTLSAKLSFAANLVLLVAKMTAAILSGSMAIITSLVDSVVDLVSGLVVWITTRAVRKTNHFKYPNGRHLLEPLAVILLSVIMGMASLQLLKEALDKITALSNGSIAPPTVDYITISISCFTVVLKLILFLLCRRIMTPTVQALAQDHRNDVLSNTLAIVCGYIGSREIQDELGERCLVFLDPIGAIIISLYIAITWYITGRDQTKLLTGYKADPVIVSKLIWICMNHHNLIESVNHVSAYHVGYEIAVELDICVSAELSNYKAQEVKDSLKTRLEKVDDISKVYISVVSYSEEQSSKL